MFNLLRVVGAEARKLGGDSSVFPMAVLVFCSGVSFCFASVGSSGSLMRGLSDLGDDLKVVFLNILA